MVQQHVLELVNQGNLEAIDTLINYSLESKGIIAKIGLNEGCLFISLLSQQVPAQQDSVSCVRNEIISWQAESFKSAKIYGRRFDQTLPAWQQEIDLASELAPSWGKVVQLIVGNHKIKIASSHGCTVDVASAQQRSRLWSRSTPVFLLPRLFLNLLGRSEEVNVAIAALQSNQSVEFYSQTGLGKTALLCHLAYNPQITSIFPDGIVQLQGNYQPVADRIQSLFEAFYDSDLDYKPTQTESQQLLKNKQALIILDDQQLTSNELEKLLNAVPGCSFLLASPQPRLLGEGQSVMLPGLPLTDALALLELQLKRSLTAEEFPKAKELLAIFAGNPQDLLYAIGHMQTGFSLAQIVEMAQSASPRQSLMEKILALLSEPQKLVLIVLSTVCGAGLLAKQILALTGLPEIEAVLNTLVWRNLVQLNGYRYSVKETLIEVLEQEFDLTPWRLKVAAYFTHWAQQYQQVPKCILVETDAIFNILKCLTRESFGEEVLSLVKAVESALAVGKRWGIWEQVLHIGLQAARSLSDPAAEAWIWHQLGSRALCLQDTDIAIHYLTRALKLRELSGDHTGADLTRHNLNLLPLLPPPEPTQVPTSSVRVSNRTRFQVPVKALLGFPLLTLAGITLWQDWSPRGLHANDDIKDTQKNTPVDIDLLANDRGLEDDEFQVNTNVTQPENGSVAVKGKGTVRYMPKAEFSGMDSFTYTISNAEGQTDTATVTIKVKEPANREPVAKEDEAITENGQAITIAVLDNDSDPDGDQLKVIFGARLKNASIIINDDGTLTYRPRRNFFGKDRFQYRLSDGRGGIDTATVTVTVKESANKLSAVKFNQANTDYGRLTNVAVFKSDSKQQQIPPKLILDDHFSSPSGGIKASVARTSTLDLNQHRLQNPSGNSQDSAEAATITVANQEASNRLPLVPPNNTTSENSGFGSVAVVDQNNTPESNQSGITPWTVVTNPSLEVNTPTITTSRPKPEWSVRNKLPQQVNNRRGDTEVTMVAVVDSEPPKKLSLAGPDNSAIDNKTTPEGNQTELSPWRVVLTPSLNTNTPATATSRPKSQLSVEERLTENPNYFQREYDTAMVAVASKEMANKLPLAQPDEATIEQSESITIAVLDNDSDPDGDQLWFTLETEPENGSIVVNGNGTVTYIPKTGFYGQDRFKYQISDGQGGTDQATVTVTVKEPPRLELEVNPDGLTNSEFESVLLPLPENETNSDGGKQKQKNFER
ncbi:MAG: tandem-95 repeat protein [Symploca sp. SIO2E9]|nr:tandem-95 repeat protein [Symploca sp. SIO2E9]